MIDLIKYMVQGVVDKVDEVDITVKDGENESHKIYEIKVNPSDMGALIGKEGRIINSIRNIAKIKAKKENIFIDIKILEPEEA